MKTIAILVLSIMLLMVTIPCNYLIIMNESDELIYSKRVGSGIGFVTEIEHSIHHSTVEEFYYITSEGQMFLKGSQFSDVGWGMAQEFELIDDSLEMKRLNYPMDQLVFRASHFVNPIIKIENDSVLNLNVLVADHERLVIQCEKMSWINRILIKVRGKKFRVKRKIFPLFLHVWKI